MKKAFIINGLGIGCHREVAHAFERAGAEAEIIHMKQLLTGEKDLFESQILNLTGGFLHGDILGAGMCAANELEHARLDDERKIKDLLIEYAGKGNVIYGQCNGFQLLVKTGLLPGIDDDYSSQTVTLTHNECGNYRVAPVLHRIEKDHFAFRGIDHDDLFLWCRHGEGKIQFHSEKGHITKEQGEKNRKKIAENGHILLKYAVPGSLEPAEKFPHNPNGSIDAIAGLANPSGRIFGHMAHPEVSVYSSRDPRWFMEKDRMRRQGIKAGKLDEKKLEGIGLKIFQNIVNGDGA
jgi:phosphoribosylformylglycinamidine synthase